MARKWTRTYLEKGERLYDHAEVAEPVERIVACASRNIDRGHRERQVLWPASHCSLSVYLTGFGD
jgi:hypothetical protein